MKSALCVLGLLGWTVGGCGGDDGKQCVQTLCDPATAGAVCVGHAAKSCAADGKSFVLSACSAQQRCETGACVARACTTLGESTCATPTAARRCKDDGSGFEDLPCATGEVCKDGACVASACQGEPDRCTNSGWVHCEGGAWVQENCPVTELCSLGDSGVARCSPKVCTPEARRCDGDTVRSCDARGAAEAIETCARGEICSDGVCQAEVCGKEPADTSEADGGGEVVETDAAEPDSEILFTLAGAVTTFDINAVAEFDAGDRRLTVRAAKGQKALELRFAPANATVQGVFSSDVFNPVKVLVCYDSGGTPAAFTDCEGEFTHHSVAYSVEVTRNDGPGGRFEATFSATLEDVNTDQITLTAGQINVKYR